MSEGKWIAYCGSDSVEADGRNWSLSRSRFSFFGPGGIVDVRGRMENDPREKSTLPRPVAYELWSETSLVCVVDGHQADHIFKCLGVKGRGPIQEHEEVTETWEQFGPLGPKNS